MSLKPYLSSNRLDFYAPQLSDISNFERIQTDPEIMRYMGRGVRSADSARPLLMGCIMHQDTFGFSLGTVFLKGTDTLVGQAGLYHFNLNHNDARIEIAFAFFKPFWGNGFATESICALQNWGLAQHEIKKIIAVVNPNNARSIKVLQKNGFRFRQRSCIREGVKARLYEYRAASG